MNTKLFTLALIEILMSVLISVAIIYVSFSILQRLFFKKESFQGKNTAFAVFTSGVVLSIGLILSEILPSITNVIRLSSAHSDSVDMTTIVTYSGLYLLIGFAVAIFINLSVFLLFSILTRGINEFKAIKENNVPVSILVVALLLSITLIAKDSIALLISSLVPYPEVSNFL